MGQLKNKFKKFHRTSQKFKILFLEHQILEASRHHQLPQYAPQIEAYQLSFTLHLRICQSAHAILRNSIFYLKSGQKTGEWAKIQRNGYF